MNEFLSNLVLFLSNCVLQGLPVRHRRCMGRGSEVSALQASQLGPFCAERSIDRPYLDRLPDRPVLADPHYDFAYPDRQTFR